MKVIEKIRGIIDDENRPLYEQPLQDTLCEAPWLINPMWSPITANQALSTLKDRFEKHFEEHTGESISLGDFSESKKRPDFVLFSNDFGLQIIEIKKPGYKLSNKDWDRIQRYIDQMRAFLGDDANEEYKRIFREFRVTIVCDGQNLTGSQATALKSFQRDKVVEMIKWDSFLLRTRLMHKEFLSEARRQNRFQIQ